ncbi:MAG: hypothetical protein ACM3VT_10410 [Solirubrobacterales bacterium]
MRRVRRCAERAEIARCRRIIEVYAPYVLVRCAAFTDSWRLSLEIGAYVLLCTCLLASRMTGRVRVGVLVEAMLDVVGPDVASRRGREDDPPVFADARMLGAAKAMNRLAWPLREAIVLGPAAGRSKRELASLLHKPFHEVRVHLERAKAELAEDLGIGILSVCVLLADFAAALDADWIEQVADCVMEHLIAGLNPAAAPPVCWMN